MGLKKIKIWPVKKIKGVIELPGDKSISHRAVIFGSLARGKTKIENFLWAEDALRTINCFKNLGVKIKLNRSKKTVEIFSAGVTGFRPPEKPLYVGNSGTTIRILTGILAGLPFASEIFGDASISRRPMNRVVLPLKLMGAEIKGQEKNNEIYPALKITGRKLRGIKYKLPMASAQVKSALLLAGLLARGMTQVKEPIASRDHTERMMKFFGVELKKKNGFLAIAGGQKFSGRKLKIPGDFSSGAFFIVAALIIPGAKLVLKNIGLNPGRTGLLEVLKKMGARIKIKNKKFWGAEPVGDLLVEGSKLRGIRVGGAVIPRMIDEIPILAVAALNATGRTVVDGAAELRFKESDRIKAIVSEFKKMVGKISEKPDGFAIEGGRPLRGAKVLSHGDHRIAMALAIAGLNAAGRTTITNTGCINTSFPDFLKLLKKVLLF